jgi:hypothetical protein
VPKAQPHCVNGHPFTPGNTMWRQVMGRNGTGPYWARRCRTCHSISSAVRYWFKLKRGPVGEKPRRGKTPQPAPPLEVLVRSVEQRWRAMW